MKLTTTAYKWNIYAYCGYWDVTSNFKKNSCTIIYMRMLRNTIYFLILTFLFSCTTKRRENVKESDFIGSWHSIKRDIPYSATLQIDKDKTFKFKFGACMIHGSSAGKWILKDNNIILKSNNADTCTLTREFGVNCIAKDFDTTSLNEPIRKKDCASNDTYFVIFDNNNFIIRHDSLIYLTNKENLCPDIKDIFVKR